ncbi:MAG: hypothetical protein CMB75_04210 [Euryarchaeota archaeon]|nr:hypothetical protein [Euryarchaeota archaeon]
MHYDVVRYVVGQTLRIISVPFILAALALSLMGQESSWYLPISSFAVPALIALVLGTLLSRVDKEEIEERIRDREAFASVGLGWLAIVLIGTLPYWLGGVFTGPGSDGSFSDIIHGFVYSLFESMAGFTTTGATVIESSSSPLCDESTSDCLASLPKMILLYRSATQWLGGMGVIMLGLLIFSRTVGGGKSLARAELTGPTVSPTGITFQSTARILWAVFVAMTLIEFVMLIYLTDLSLFDSLNISMTTIATGGMTPTDAGIGGYDSGMLELIIIFFMFVSGLNFAAIYLIVIKAQFSEIKDEEMRNYFFIWVTSIALASGFMALAGSSFSESLRDTAFTLTSIITSTGYSTADWGSWQLFPKLILLILMAIGATAGSTSGGLKVMRATMLLKIARREIMTIVQPKRVVPIRVNGEVVDERRVSLAIGMICAWILLCAISILILSLVERSIDLESAVSVIFSMLGNTGPALGAYGPTHTYASMSDLGLLGSSILMWLGRLEILTVLILFNPRLWSKSN